MFTASNVDRYIDRYIGQLLINIAVDSRLTIHWLAIDYRSTGDREVVDCRSIVGRPSINRAINHRPSIGRYFIYAPRPNIGHMSVVYRSTVGDMLVNCWWHIGQLSVAYQLCVNLAGESNGFPFERLSNVIMLLGKMLQCKAQLLYEANRWALWTMGMVIFSFVPIVSSIGQVSAKYRPSVDSRSSGDRVSIECRPLRQPI